MEAKEFIAQYGEPADENVRFVNAGNIVSAALIDLLNAFAAHKAASQAVPKGKVKTGKGVSYVG
ncbi:hypothetical protein [Chitinophaga sp. HK235]|uniref:hypothetical protein n=1 Tax=Chitinophaga sp. HK235 TaxID=2952571 RepID=UPI001BA9B96F|nr:hypothetical protein [Chitinophaga sp. HK235]